MARPLIAIVGRPNVGKSTLFNRLVGRRRALVQDRPGVTRDRHHADAELDGREVTVVDTGGFVPVGSEKDPLESQVRLQAQAAVEACHVVLLVVDARAGRLGADESVAASLRKSGRPVLLVVNKVDSPAMGGEATADFHRLGLGTPFPVSAEHGLGVGALVEAILPRLPPVEVAPPPEEGVEPPPRPLRVAIVGRPNVGKSTLVNALLGEERLVVSAVAGTTRDAIDSSLTYRGRHVVLTDTAGIRRKSNVTEQLEQFTVLRAMRAIEDSDVAVLVLDATEAGVDQDLKIAALAVEKGRALLVCVNKWDLVRGEATEAEYRQELKWYLDFVSWAPMVFVTARDGLKVTKVLDLALMLEEQLHFHASTPLLNRVLEHVRDEHPMPWIGKRALKLYYAAQVGHAPPAFAFTCNIAHDVPEPFQRYVSNHLRETFRLKVPLRLFFRERPQSARRAEVARQFKARAASKRRR